MPWLLTAAICQWWFHFNRYWGQSILPYGYYHMAARYFEIYRRLNKNDCFLFSEFNKTIALVVDIVCSCRFTFPMFHVKANKNIWFLLLRTTRLSAWRKISIENNPSHYLDDRFIFRMHHWWIIVTVQRLPAHIQSINNKNSDHKHLFLLNYYCVRPYR
jgi:hypothetical protein